MSSTAPTVASTATACHGCSQAISSAPAAAQPAYQALPRPVARRSGTLARSAARSTNGTRATASAVIM